MNVTVFAVTRQLSRKGFNPRQLLEDFCHETIDAFDRMIRRLGFGRG